MLQAVVDTVPPNNAKPALPFAMRILNGKGDIEIAWDENSKAMMMEVIQKKLDEGFSFFEVVEVDGQEERRQITNVNEITGDRVKIDDELITAAFLGGHVEFNRVKPSGRGKTGKRLKKPKDIAGTKSVAVQPMAGG